MFRQIVEAIFCWNAIVEDQHGEGGYCGAGVADHNVVRFEPHHFGRDLMQHNVGTLCQIVEVERDEADVFVEQKAVAIDKEVNKDCGQPNKVPRYAILGGGENRWRWIELPRIELDEQCLIVDDQCATNVIPQ